MVVILRQLLTGVICSITIELHGSLIEMENTILEATNEIGGLATSAVLKLFDSDGTPILREGLKWIAKGQILTLHSVLDQTHPAQYRQIN